MFAASHSCQAAHRASLLETGWRSPPGSVGSTRSPVQSAGKENSHQFSTSLDQPGCRWQAQARRKHPSQFQSPASPDDHGAPPFCEGGKKWKNVSFKTAYWILRLSSAVEVAVWIIVGVMAVLAVASKACLHDVHYCNWFVWLHHDFLTWVPSMLSANWNDL